MRAFLLFLLVLFFSPNTNSEDPMVIMRRVTTEYNILSGASFDTLAHLGKISEKAKNFLKLTGPAGSILAAFAETVFPPEHPVLKSLAFLHQHIDRKFEAQGRFIEGALSSLRSAQDLNHYDTVVNVPLARLTKIFKKVINPAKTKTHKEQFVAACTRWQFTPLDILEFINTKVNINCKKQKTREMLPIISEVKSVFDEVFVIINDQKYATSYENFFTTYIVVLESFESLSVEQANQTLADLRELFTKKDGPDFDLDELIRSIFAVVPGPFSDVCLLRSVYESYAAKRNELMRLSESVTIDVIDTALIGGFCANLSFSCAAEQVEEQLEELGSYVRDITGNMSQWIGKELSDAWPEEVIRNIKREITKDISDPYAYNTTANRINNEVLSRGPLGYVSQVLVTQNWDYISIFTMLLIKFLIFLTFPAFLLAMNLPGGNEVNCWATRNRRTPSPRVTGGRTPTQNRTQSGEGMRAETSQNVSEIALDDLDGSMDQSNFHMLVDIAAGLSDNAKDDGVTGAQNEMNVEEEAKGAEGEDEAEEQQQMNVRPIVLAIQKQKPREEASLPTKKRLRSMQQIVGEEGRGDAKQTAEATASVEELRRNSERKTPKRNANKSGKDKAASSARARTTAKEKSKGGRVNNLKPLIDLPMDSYVFDLIRGRESSFTDSPHSEGTPNSNNNNNNNTAWHRNIHQIPISEMFNSTSAAAAGEEGSSSTKIINNLGEEKRTQSMLTASSKEAKDVDSLAGKVDRMRVASSSSLSGANTPTDVAVRKTVEEREPRTGTKIRESVIKAGSGSVKEMGENVLKFGFFQIDFFNKGNLKKLINNRREFAKLVIKRDNDQHGKGAETVSKLIVYLKEKGDPVINEIIAEVLEESAIFGDNSQKGQKHILLFTYIRLYRKLANALRWALISDSGDNEDFVKETNTLLKWLNEMGDTLLNALSKSSIMARWVKHLCRTEAAVELTNFGIFLILPHHTWQKVGAERPTAVNDLFETIGTTEILEQINDPCDTNCIDQMVKQKLELMNRLRDNSVEKISEIVKNKVSEVEDLLKEMANIKKIPTKNCLFSAIFKQIKEELESADFAEISVPKLSEEKPKLAKEKEDGLAFLEKCIKMLDEKNIEYCQCVQKELQMFNELSKANFGGGKTKSDGREGTFNDPISLEE